MVDGRERAIFFCEQLLTYTLVTLLMKLSGSQNTIQKKPKPTWKKKAYYLGREKGLVRKRGRFTWEWIWPKHAMSGTATGSWAAMGRRKDKHTYKYMDTQKIWGWEDLAVWWRNHSPLVTQHVYFLYTVQQGFEVITHHRCRQCLWSTGK